MCVSVRQAGIDPIVGHLTQSAVVQEKEKIFLVFGLKKYNCFVVSKVIWSHDKSCWIKTEAR